MDKDDISYKMMQMIRLLKEGAKDRCEITTSLKKRVFSKEKDFEDKLVELARYLKKNAK